MAWSDVDLKEHGRRWLVDVGYQTWHGVSVSTVPSLVILAGLLLLLVGLTLWVGRRGFCHALCWMAPLMILGRAARPAATPGAASHGNARDVHRLRSLHACLCDEPGRSGDGEAERHEESRVHPVCALRRHVSQEGAVARLAARAMRGSRGRETMRTATYEDAVRFHGHSCPGLAVGYRMTTAALAALGVDRAEDEELVAVVENDACGVDAVQVVAGCSFGKGNLVFRDYGKHVYTFFSRRTGSGVRVLGHRRGMPDELHEDREGKIRWILTAPEADVVSWREVTASVPPPARLHASAPCAACGEPVMETRLRRVGGRLLCIPCADAERSCAPREAGV